jgi:hypothetical protein
MAVDVSGSVLPGLAGEVGAVLRRQALRAFVPAAVLGAGADGLLLLRHSVLGELVLGIVIAIAFMLYVGYAELLVAADRRGTRPSRLSLLRGAARVTPPLLVASIGAVTLPLAATGLLVLPGLWLMTRWVLFAPAIVNEHLTPAGALRRSAGLVRGAFWAVAGTATAAVLIEHAVLHATAHTAEPALGSLALGLVGAALAGTLVSAPAAFTISVVYGRLARVA